MPSRTLLAALAVLATVIAVGAGAALAADGGASAPTDSRSITVAGAGQIDAQPDAAEVRLSVTARGSDAASVGEDVASGAQQLRTTLSEFGVSEDNIQTQGYSLHEAPRSRDTPESTTYVGEQSFTVALSDVDQVGSLVDAALAGGADSVGGVQYTLSADRRESLRDEAIGVAIDEARSEAGVIANETGLAVGQVRTASTQDAGVSPYRVEFTAAQADAGGAGTEIDPRDVTVSATVEVTFDASVA